MRSVAIAESAVKAGGIHRGHDFSNGIQRRFQAGLTDFRCLFGTRDLDHELVCRVITLAPAVARIHSDGGCRPIPHKL